VVQRIAGTLRAGHPQARLAEFAALCERERCPFAVVGSATDEGRRLVVGYAGATAGDRPADGRAVRQAAEDAPRRPRIPRRRSGPTADTDALDLREAGLRVLAHPSVASNPS
jgi:phosphoribosylformylglycinamidine synthase